MPPIELTDQRGLGFGRPGPVTTPGDGQVLREEKAVPDSVSGFILKQRPAIGILTIYNYRGQAYLQSRLPTCCIPDTSTGTLVGFFAAGPAQGWIVCSRPLVPEGPARREVDASSRCGLGADSAVTWG